MKYKSLLKGLFLLTGVLLVSAFLAPLLAKFIPYEFDRILSRVVMVLFLVVAVLARKRPTSMPVAPHAEAAKLPRTGPILPRVLTVDALPKLALE